ncbi:class I SAM-dependent methyltransferase [Lederbergia sp. NSJ-179]|uniref:class I SAM-dependent methyltransferase n=1 Tax=Lederbergia sp. NSJ-179 TaxID=2931402 RepID=UPI001FD546FA|nr:class I SAM-dependent methyltransferase [Lederbergia sp. NSJ-179]MCJ7839726.1 class I SAM-dependent methyltransferase [Lederbergia sp. NSJ-179]
MSMTATEKLFTIFDQSSTILQEELACTYLEALVETGDNLFQEKLLQDSISEITKKRLQKEYAEVNLASYSSEEIRRAYQLAILKGMKGTTQTNHQMTPDSIGLLIGYLTQKFLGNQERLSILDPAVGTGNLLATVVNMYEQVSDVQSFGVEVDEILIRLAYIGANLQRQQTEFFHQDGLASLLIDPVDLVICDLPVGYYPNDAQAAQYELNATEGHAYAHHLFIEQGLRHTKPGGYLFFLIPNGLFETEEAEKLQRFLKDTAYIQAVVQLPFSIFKNNQAAKSIFILQKKSPEIKAPNEVLLASLPSLTKKEAVDKILWKMEKWFKDNKNEFK